METVRTTQYTLIVSTLVVSNLTVTPPSKHIMQQAIGDYIKMLRYYQVTIGERKEKSSSALIIIINIVSNQLESY